MVHFGLWQYSSSAIADEVLLTPLNYSTHASDFHSVMMSLSGDDTFQQGTELRIVKEHIKVGFNVKRK